MSEAATVFWTLETTMLPANLGEPIILGGVDRMFESVENALRFVMETLPDTVRSTAMIQTDNASIQAGDIERMYRSLVSAPAS